MKLEFKIARRFLRSNLGQTFLIILGIAVGVSVQIFIGSLIQGLQKSLIDKTIGKSPQITITALTPDKRISGYEEMLSVIKSTDESVENVSIADDNAAFVEYGENSWSLLIRGFDIEEADKIYDFIGRLEEGTYPKNEDEIILGIDTKKENGIIVNDEVKVITADGKQFNCKVVGFYDLNVSSINKNWAITTIETSQNMFGTKGTVNSIEIQVNEDSAFTADETAEKLMGALNNGDLKIENWKQQNEQLLSGLQGQSISSIMIQVFVLISVVLGIASVLAIMVMQKSKQIGILKAMGIKNSSTSYIFLFEGLILGFFGAILGILLGLGLAFVFTKFALNPDGSPVVAIYISYPFIMASGLIAVGVSILAAFIPAIKSSKLDPIDIIRNN